MTRTHRVSLSAALVLLAVGSVSPPASAQKAGIRFHHYMSKRPVQKPLHELHKLITGKGKLSAKTIGELVKMAPNLADLAEDCGGILAKLGADYQTDRRYEYTKKGIACRYATTFMALVVEQASGVAKARLNKELKYMRKIMRNLARGKRVYGSSLQEAMDPTKPIAEAQKRIEAMFKVLGKPAPTVSWEPLRAEAKKVTAAVQEAAKVKRWGDVTFKNKRAAKAVKKALKAQGLSFKGARFSSAEWEIQREYGTPTHRTLDALGLAQKKGEPFCRLYVMYVRQNHKGRSKYGKATATLQDELDRFVVAACK